MTDNRWIDPEIEGMLDGDPELVELAQRIRASRPQPALDPRFSAVLRAQLMREATTVLGSATGRAARAPRGSVRRRRTPWLLRPARFAWAGAGLGVALVAAAVLSVIAHPLQDHQVTAMSPVAQLHAVSPDNVITVSFSQPMNESAVVAGLHIQPATQVTTSWQGNNLVITPTHHLAGNTPYTVTIDRAAAKAASGEVAAADIRISFGTAPTPPALPQVAQLAPTAIGAAGAPATLIPLPNGSIVVTNAPPPPSTPPSATPASSASPGATGASSATPTTAAGTTASPHGKPTASPTPTTATSPATSASASPDASPSASPSAPVALTGDMVVVSARGAVTDLGPAASSAALSPSGFDLIATVPTQTGTDVVLVPVDGSKRSVLASLPGPALATGWLSGSAALVAEGGQVVSVDLQGSVAQLAALPAGTTTAVISPDGRTAFAGNGSTDGQLVALQGGASRALSGSRTAVAFSGDGSTVAWVAQVNGVSRLVTSPVSRDAADTVPLQHPADTLSNLALDRTGGRVAFVEQAPAGTPSLQLASLPSGTLLASGPAASVPVFSSHGDQLAFLAGGSVDVAPVSGGGGSVLNVLPDGAAATLEAFVDAQVAGNATTLATLVRSGSGVDAMSVTPHGLSRAYVVSETVNADGTVGATARLIEDAGPGQPAASFADETMTLSKDSSGAYLVSALNVPPIHAESAGPHVVSVTPSITGQTLVLRVAFDSDLQATTVPGAVTVTRRGGGPQLPATVVYDANTRTATVTLTVTSATPVTISVATTLVDVNGQPLAAVFTADEGGGPGA